MLQYDDMLTNEANEIIDKSDCHLYLVCKRNKIRFSTSVKVQDGLAKGELTYHERDKLTPLPFEYSDSDLSTIECEYPYNSMYFFDKAEMSKSWGKLFNFVLHLFANNYFTGFDLEVLYVGKSIGNKIKRTANKRLKGHDKLSEILNHTLNLEPYSEIFLILPEFKQQIFSSASIKERDEILGLLKDIQDSKKSIEETINAHLITSIVESAFIHYFQPKYNRNLKRLFPDKKHTSYNAIFNIGLHNVTITFDTKSIFTRLFSKGVDPEFVHKKNYLL
jgi:hypothetical protein